MLSENRTGPHDLPEEIDTVVIGGGQAGLAAGYHLLQHEVPFVILDGRDRIGDSWRNRWDSLRLFTPNRYSSLPGLANPGPPGRYPSKDEMADYLEAYAGHFELPVRLGLEVESLLKSGDGYEVVCDGHRIVCDNVIVSTGFDSRPHVPALAGDLDDGIVQIHSKDYRNPSQLRDGDVLVVGAGNSGAEISVEIARHGHTTWLSGRDPGDEPTRAGSVADRFVSPFMWFAATRIIKVDGRLGRKVRDSFLNPPRGIPRGRIKKKDILAAGIEWVPRTERASGGYPQLEDGRLLEVANVVWCTGFTPGLDWIHLPITDGYGIPKHTRGVADSVTGLYFLGLYFQYSLSSPLVGGVGRDARYVVDHLAARRRSQVMA